MIIDIASFYAATGQAKLAELPTYEARIVELVPPGADVTLTARAPVWLYLRLAHVLHGRARILRYSSPNTDETGSVEIFNRNPN